MKITKHLIFLFVVLFISTSTLEAQAWKKKLKNLGDTLEKVAEPASDDADAQTAITSEAVVLMTANAIAKLAAAQSLIAEAEGNKELAAQLKNVSESIDGSDTKVLKGQVALVKETAKSQQEIFKQKNEMSAEAKKLYGQALVPFTEGAIQTIALAQPIEQFAKNAEYQIKSVQSQPWKIMEVKKTLEVGLFLVKNVPALIITLGKSTKDLMTYSKANGLDTKKAEKIKIDSSMDEEEVG